MGRGRQGLFAFNSIQRLRPTRVALNNQTWHSEHRQLRPPDKVCTAYTVQCTGTVLVPSGGVAQSLLWSCINVDLQHQTGLVQALHTIINYHGSNAHHAALHARWIAQAVQHDCTLCSAVLNTAHMCGCTMALGVEHHS